MSRFCFEFIDFMLKSKSLLNYTNIFSTNDYDKNDIFNDSKLKTCSCLIDRS